MVKHLEITEESLHRRMKQLATKRGMKLKDYTGIFLKKYLKKEEGLK